MLQKFIRFISENNLFKKNDTVLLAVSGGIDSVVMTELFEISGFRFAIAHCNFKLRGSDSDEDEVFVSTIAESKGKRFHVRQFNVKEYTKKEKISVQMAARKLRLQWFEELIKEFGYGCYATAHHNDDQIETFFINLLRGSGIAGLHGILPKHGNLIHPMLFTDRKAIEAFVQEKKLDFRMDRTNMKTDYMRNKIRHKLLPVLKSIQPDFDLIFTRNIYRFRQAEEIYRQRVNEVIEDLSKLKNDQLLIPIRGLIGLNPVETYLFEILRPYNFQYQDADAIIRSLNAQSGKVFYSSTHKLIRDRDFLIICNSDLSKEEQDVFPVNTHSGELQTPAEIKFSVFDKPEDFCISQESNIALLDADTIGESIYIRHWKKGDYFFHLGMDHKKLISDFFTDLKFAIPDKENTWLLCSGKDIVWIVGCRIDNRFKITEQTKRILKAESFAK